MRELVDACRQINKAFATAGLNPPTLVSVDHGTFMHMTKFLGADAQYRYAAQGLDVVEIAGIKFTSKLPQGIFQPER